MLGVEFEKNRNVTFLIYNEGTFFSKKDLQLHSSFKEGARKRKLRKKSGLSIFINLEKSFYDRRGSDRFYNGLGSR